MGHEPGDTQESKAWYEEIGARGLASLGALSGLIVSLMIVFATAAPLPARPSERGTKQRTEGKKPESVETIPASPTSSGRVAPQQPRVSDQTSEAAGSVATPPNAVSTNPVRPLISALEPERSASEPAPTFSSDTSSSGPTAAPSWSGSANGTVQVRGYYRKNGTYVQPHTRRSPRR
jgi:hypothetical protein